MSFQLLVKYEPGNSVLVLRFPLKPTDVRGHWQKGFIWPKLPECSKKRPPCRLVCTVCTNDVMHDVEKACLFVKHNCKRAL